MTVLINKIGNLNLAARFTWSIIMSNTSISRICGKTYYFETDTKQEALWEIWQTDIQVIFTMIEAHV